MSGRSEGRLAVRGTNRHGLRGLAVWEDKLSQTAPASGTEQGGTAVTEETLVLARLSHCAATPQQQGVISSYRYILVLFEHAFQTHLDSRFHSWWHLTWLTWPLIMYERIHEDAFVPDAVITIIINKAHWVGSVLWWLMLYVFHVTADFVFKLDTFN